MSRSNVFNSPKNTLVLILLILIGYSGNIFSTPLSDSTSISEYQISGIITDILTMEPIDNARISLLDPLTGKVLSTDIFTDENGSYVAIINLNLTGVHVKSPKVSSYYQISEFHPNPVEPRNNEILTICYQVPGNVPETPIFEMYNILGNKVNDKAFLTSGIYSFRLKFNNSHFSEPRKLMLTSDGFLSISINQVSAYPEQAFKTTKSAVGLSSETDDPFDVIFMIEKSGYACMERSYKLVQGTNNVTDFSMVQIGNQSTVTLDTTGGIITVANNRNDTIKLTVPRYALWESTTITLTTFDTPPNNPVSNNIFPGINISPAGFRPHRPVNLKVDFATTHVDTILSTLFYIKQSDFVLPLGNLVVTDSSIEGEIYHFSDFSAGDVSGSEVIDQAGKAANGGALNPYDWQNTYEVVEALTRWSEILQFLGRDAEAESVRNEMKEIMERDAGNFINQPIPEEPGGKYMNTLTRYGEVVYSVLEQGDLVDEYSDRVAELLNRCDIHGDIVCLYDIHHYGPGYWDVWIVNGIIPIVSDRLESSRIAGYGINNVNVTGQAADGTSIIGFGMNTVNLGGELSTDSQGDFWLEVDWTENWWTTSSWTFFPPDAPPFTISQPPHTDNFLLKFPTISGSHIQLPNGNTWFLNLYSLFAD